MSLAKRLARTWHMARNVPPRQVLRRIALRGRFALQPHLADRGSPPPDPVHPLPRPPFGRRSLLRPIEGGFRLRLPWGERPVPVPVAWNEPLLGSPPDLARAEANNLHVMEYLEAADDALFQALVADWIAGNPRRGQGAARFAWRPYNLSLRVVVWLQEMARREGRLDPALVARMNASLADQLDHLAAHLETDLRGNHLVKNVKALLWGAACFEGPRAEAWRRLGERHLGAELAEQVLADGCHYERSPAYHCQVLADLIECRCVLQEGRSRARLEETLRRMLPVMRLLTHPDGGIALFNDGALAMAYAPAEILAAWRRLTGEAVPAPCGPFALRDAGYFGLATADERLVVDCGPLAPPYLAGHGHGDLLAFEWSVGGRRIVVDQGTYQYVAGPGREATRATRSHNTVTLDDEDQSDFYGAFRVGRRAAPELRVFEADGQGFRFEGSHDGYAKLPGHPRHVRRMTAGPGRLVVEDTVEGGRGQAAVARLLLHPACAVAREDDRRLCIRSGDVAVDLEADWPVEIEPASWFPNLYVSEPTRRLVVRFQGTLRFKLERTPSTAPAGKKPPP